MHKNPALPV